MLSRFPLHRCLAILAFVGIFAPASALAVEECETDADCAVSSCVDTFEYGLVCLECENNGDCDVQYAPGTYHCKESVCEEGAPAPTGTDTGSHDACVDKDSCPGVIECVDTQRWGKVCHECEGV